ncbi:MAG: hypothetical protein QNL14_02660 [Deltaproteobacteria bacterium]|nr:hypothetical protein [Deltaproteobacteria bacterium]
MPSEKSPFFRKPVIPWYQSKTAYSVTIVIMLVVFLVGLAGISVSREIDEYNGYLWIPAVLVILSVCLMITNIIRLIRRYTS